MVGEMVDRDFEAMVEWHYEKYCRKVLRPMSYDDWLEAMEIEIEKQSGIIAV